MGKPGIEIKERIVAFAQSKFFVYGFSKISMDEIAAGLQISKRTLYEHFPGKKELLFAVMHKKMNKMAAISNEIMLSNKNVVEKIQAMSAIIPQELSEMSKAYFEDIQRNMPELWEKINEFRTKIGTANFKKLISEGKKQGIIRKDINDTLFVYMLITVIREIINPEVLINNPFSITDVIKFIMKMLWEGIFTDKGRKKYLSSKTS